MRLAVAALSLALPSLAAAQAPGAFDPTPPIAPPGMTPPAADIDEPPPATPPPPGIPVPEWTAGAPGLTPPMAGLTTIAPPRPAPTPIALATARDAADDRAYGTSTALVVPDGKVDVSLRAAPIGGIASVTAGLGAGFELSADVSGIFVEGGMASYGVSGKLQLGRKAGWALAVEGGYHQVGDDGSSDGVSDAVGLWSGGVVVSGCTDRACSALLSLGGGVLGSTEGSGHAIPYVWSSALLGTGGFRPILEGAILDGGVLGFLGARMGGKTVALDLGVGLLAGDGGGGGLPVAALSVRP